MKRLCVSPFLYKHVGVCMYVCVYVCMCVCICVFVHACVCIMTVCTHIQWEGKLTTGRVIQFVFY